MVGSYEYTCPEGHYSWRRRHTEGGGYYCTVCGERFADLVEASQDSVGFYYESERGPWTTDKP